MLPICPLPFLQEPHPNSQMRKLRPRQSQWDLNSGLPASRGLALTLKGGRVGGVLLKTVPSGPTRFCYLSGHVCRTLPDPGPPLTEGPWRGFRANQVRAQSDALWCGPAFGVVLWPACREQAITPAREGRQRLGALNWDLFGDPREGAQSLGDAPPTAAMTAWGCGLSY